MLIDILPEEFEKMARAGFFDNVCLRAQDIETARARCKSLGLQITALKAGTRYPVEKANTRYAYLQLQPRLTARVKRSDIVLK